MADHNTGKSSIEGSKIDLTSKERSTKVFVITFVQNRMVPSYEPDAIYRPSDEHATK